MKLETQVLVIGGGLTGAGVLRDLAMRGVDALLVERRDINAGASGANHGLLHSGARYAVTDPTSARECVIENATLKRVASACVDPCGGFFVSLDGDDEDYPRKLLAAAAAIGLEAEQVDPAEVLAEEPYLNGEIRAAVRVPDAAINPFMVTLANLRAATELGARVLLHSQVIAMERRGDRIVKVEALRSPDGERIEIFPEHVVSAAGPWVDQIGALAGVEVPIAYSKGSLLITNSRLVSRVVNRLRPPSDGDIIVPGESVTITGTTSLRVENLDHLSTPAAEVDLLVAEAAKVLPAMADSRFIRVYAGVRPLVLDRGEGGDRAISRSFTVFDHERDELGNLVTVAGGKLTTFRLMAEKVVDRVCQRLHNDTPCRTAEVALPGSEAGACLDTADRLRRLQVPAPDGEVICECEMVGKAQVDELVDALAAEGQPVSLNALRLRSRQGMGSCQGGFCGFRATGLLYDKEIVSGQQGNRMLCDFLEKRWGGIKPVLWGEQLRQEQLLEAIYCGSLNIDGEL